jgi:hypothetical protein
VISISIIICQWKRSLLAVSPPRDFILNQDAAIADYRTPAVPRGAATAPRVASVAARARCAKSRREVLSVILFPPEGHTGVDRETVPKTTARAKQP